LFVEEPTKVTVVPAADVELVVLAVEVALLVLALVDDVAVVVDAVVGTVSPPKFVA